MNAARRTALFAVYVAIVASINFASLRALVDLARANPTASQTILVPFITLALIFERRRSIRWSAAFDGIGIGVAGIGAAAAIAGARLGPAGDWLTLAIAGVVAIWIGGFVFVYGRQAARQAAFPLLFLLFMVPIPNGVLAMITEVLKVGSARTVAALFTLVGTPYFENRFVFTLPKFVIEIGDECSGIRSSIALMLTCLLAGELCFNRTSSKWLLAAAVVPIAILKNGVRIVTLTLLASYVDPGFLTGQLHHEGGIMFFVIVLPIVWLIVSVLRRIENAPRLGDQRPRLAAGA